MYFVTEFKLVEPKELVPLKDIIDSMMGSDAKKYSEQKEKIAPAHPQEDDEVKIDKQ